jgi:hypothetical protein
MMLLACWVVICAQYFGDYSEVKGTWREYAIDWITFACAMAYCVNVFVPPVKIIKNDNAFLHSMRELSYFFWALKMFKIFSGYVFMAIFLVPILFWCFCSYYGHGGFDNWDEWNSIKSNVDVGRGALALFCLWWITLTLRLAKILSW